MKRAVGWVVCVVFACGAIGWMAPARAADDGGAFPLRGFKGLWWDGLDNYRKAVPWAAEHHLNFVMLCYSSFAASGKDWRADYSADETAGMKALGDQADRMGVELCLSFNPGIWSKPPLTYASEADYQLAWKKVRAAEAIGIQSFALCLDDINTALQPADKEKFGTLAKAQVYFVNRLWADLHALDPHARLIFCPSAYCTREAEKHLDYIRAIGAIDPGVAMFWTGPEVCSPTITKADAEKYGAWIKRKPIVWDNYPVNDMYPWRPLLSPVKGRAADLPAATSGFMSNPMKQWTISTIPLATVARYVNDPSGYAWARAGLRAIDEWPAAQRGVVRELVGVYGTSFWGEPGFPPKPPTDKDRADTDAELQKYLLLKRHLQGALGLSSLYEDVRPTLDEDVRLLERRLVRLATPAERAARGLPQAVEGDEFAGGAGERFGYQKYGRTVNYVYAAATKRDEMHASFYLTGVPPGGAVLRMMARNDDEDDGKEVSIRLAMNGAVLFEGPSEFNGDGFTSRRFAVPAAALKAGENVLSVRNLDADGPLGMPPWFMVAGAELRAAGGK